MSGAEASVPESKTVSTRALDWMFDFAPVAAVIVGAAAQKLAYSGVEGGLLEAALVSMLFPILRRIARRRGCEPRSLLGHPLAALATAAFALSAIALYPLPRHVAWIFLAWATVAALVDLPPRRASGSDASGPRSRVRTFRIMLVASQLSLLPVCAEVLLRYLGRYATWRERNGLAYASPFEWRTSAPFLWTHAVHARVTDSRPEYPLTFDTNSEGVRDGEHPVEKPDEEYRIVALGDSFTEGVGATLENSYPMVLEQRLNTPARAKKIRMIVGGMSGSDPVFEAQLLTRRLLKYRPDLVLLTINGSDVDDLICRGGRDRFDANGAPRHVRGPWFEPLFRRSRLFRALVLDHLDYSWSLVKKNRYADLAYAACREMAETASDLRSLGEREGFELVVVIHPFEHQLRAASEDWLVPLRPLLAERGVSTIDIFPFFRSEVPTDRVDGYFWPIDRHCTKEGYDVFARGVERELAAKVARLPKPRS